MISRIRNNIIQILIIIALLTAGLFYFWSRPSATKTGQPLKPSQLDLSADNPFHENLNPPPQSDSAASAQESNSASVPAELTEKELPAWKTLDEIIKSKNDNDPRMDRELSHLSAGFHKALYKKYASFKPEARNERGTIVFLVARDLKDPADLDFLQSVYQESPCLNMGDCTASPEADPQDIGAQQTTLNYPQLAGLFQLDQQISKHPEFLKDPSFRAGIYSLLKTAENFPAPQVHQKAQQIREKYGL
jgi:hypothetical protein